MTYFAYFILFFKSPIIHFQEISLKSENSNIQHLIFMVYCRYLKYPKLGQMRYFKSLTWLHGGLRRIAQKKLIIYPYPRSDFFCFIPLTL